MIKKPIFIVCHYVRLCIQTTRRTAYSNKKQLVNILSLFFLLHASYMHSQSTCPFDESVFSGTITTTTAGATKLKASDAANNHRFGERVVIDGNIAAVASRSNGAAAGKIYIFTNDGAGNWTEQTILTASDDFAGDNFGSDIALEGNYLLVGARSQLNGSNVDTGAAYLFEYNGVNTWTEVKKFEPSDGASGYRFGESVDLEGNIALVGARNGCTGGCAYLYENDGTNTFTYTETKLEPQVQSGYSGARFGNDVHVKDGRAYVGGPYDYSSVGRASAGSVQIWDQANDGTWSRTHRLRGTETSESFGWAIDVEGDYLAIGAMNFETGTTTEADLGRVFVYKADANGDYLEANRVMIQNDDKDSFTDQRFGTDVVLENGYLYVGTWGDGTINGDAVYIFQDDGSNNWTQIAKITSGGGWDEFANKAVDVSFPYLLIGQNEDDSPSNSGSVYFVPLANQIAPVASITETVGVNTMQSNGIIKVSFDDEATETQIKFSIDGGTTYPYIFDDTLGTEEITNLAIGTYDVWVAFDESSCPISLGSFDINEIAYTNIPDTNFEAALEALGYDDVSGDGQVPTSLIEVVTDLNVSNDGITDLTGIEDFTALVDLRCHINNLTTIDISNNANLEQLRCYDNPITDIDVSNNAQLSFLNVRDCSLTSLDVTNNTLLTGLKFFGTTITTIDLSQNTLLEELDCKSTSLVSLDLSNNTALTSLIAHTNPSLSYLNMKNGNNTNVSTFQTHSSPNLSCIIVDDAAYSTTNWTNIDAASSFSDTYCRYTAIPDANFEAALEGLGYDDISGDGQVPTALIEVVTDLTAQFQSITDFTGIEDFTAIENLTISYNSFTSLDVSNNANLTLLNCGYSNLTSIDVSNNLALETLWVNETDVSSLNLELNTNLTSLTASSMSNLTSLNIKNGNNTNVTQFTTVNSTNLSCIFVDDPAYSTTNWTDIESTTFFSNTYCAYTTVPDTNFEAALEALGYDDISGDGQVPTALIEVVTSLNITNDGITDLTGIEDFRDLTNLLCSNNVLGTIDISNNTNLIQLNAHTTSITSIDLSNNLLLENVVLYGNSLTSIDVTNNTQLRILDLFQNQISELDLQTNLLLENLMIDNNDLISLDLSANTAITQLICNNNNNLSYLNVQNGNYNNVTTFVANNNSSLTCILVDDAAYATTNWTNIDVTTSFSDTYCLYTTIPDTNFEAALEALGYDDISGDGQVPTKLIEVVTSLNVASASISDLTGIEDFAALERLTCNDNSIQNLDLTNNSQLEYIKCNENGMDNLNLTGLTNFEELIGYYNDFTSFDFSGHPNLNKVSLFGNSLISLDLSNNPALLFVRLDQNNLTELNVKNGTNTNITYFNTNSNSNLACILVDDAAYSTTNWTSINGTTSFSDTYCEYTAIPDSNFEAALEALGYDDISGDGQVPTTLIEVITVLNIENEAISDLTGIQDFTALENLFAADNILTAIDVSQNSNLRILDIANSSVSTIDVSNNLELTDLAINNNGLSNLDVTQNSNLNKMYATGNSLSTIDLSNNLELTHLYLIDNSLSEIDLSPNTDLQFVGLSGNMLSTLDSSNNPLLQYLDVQSNTLTSLNTKSGGTVTAYMFLYANNNPDLTCIVVDDIDHANSGAYIIDMQTSFSDTYCRYTAIPDTDFEAVLEALGYDDISGDGQVPTALIEVVTSLNLNGYSVSDLTGIEDFIAIETLNCRGNNLTSIDVSNNLFLDTLWLANNSLSAIDVSNNPLLEKLEITNSTLITSLDLSNNPLLELLEGNDTSISSIDFSNNLVLEDVDIRNTQLTAIDVSLQTALVTIKVSNNPNLSYLNVKNGNNTSITTFQSASTPNLSCILVDDAGYSTTNWTNIGGTNSFSNTYCEYTAIPDSNFEAELEALGYDDISGDGQVPTALIEVVTNLNLSNDGITDATGIEDFIALTNLNVSDNTLGTIDITNNSNLQILSVSGCSLTNLDISQNTALQELYADSNSFTSIDTSTNTVLTSIVVYGNQIANADFSTNTLLKTLDLFQNNLTTLDVSNNTALEALFCDNNDLEILDVSANTALTTLICNDNELTSLNLQNGNNTSLASFNATNNAGLSCILVDDVAYATTNLTNIDGGVTFSSTYCRYTAIPDANFEAALEALGYDDITADGQVPTVLIETITTLSVLEKSIADLTGIADFVALTSLDARRNDLTSLDVSNNTLLETLLCQENNVLASLNVSNNAALSFLVCDNNQLTTLDISACVALESINISDNPITAINTDTNIVLDTFTAENTSLEALDFSNNPAMIELEVTNSNLRSLNFQNGNNTNISDFYVTGNSALNCILVDDAVYSTTNWTDIDVQISFSDTICLDYTYVPDDNFEATLEALGYDDISNDNFVPTASIIGITELNLRDDNIADLTGIEDFQALIQLNCSKNVLTSLDISNNTALEILFTGENLLTSIDVSNNTNLGYLDVNDNNISTLDVSNNTALYNLDVSENNFSAIDVTMLTSLESLSLSDNSFSTIDVSNNTLLKNFDADNCQLTSFDASGLANLESISIQSNSDITTLNTTGATSLTNLVVRFGKLAAVDISTNINLNLIFLDGHDFTSFDMTNNPLVTILIAGSNPLLTTMDLRNGSTETINLFQTTGNDLLTCINVDNPAYATANLTNIDAHTSFGITSCGVYAYVPDDNFEAALGVLGYDDISDDNQIPLASIDMLTTLDVSGEGIIDLTGIEEFVALTSLDVSGNTIVDYDFSTNPLISTLNIANNQLVIFDVSANTALTDINVSNNQLLSFNIQNGTNTNITNFDATGNSGLECILVDDAAYSTTNWTSIDMQTAFSETDCTTYTAIPDANFEAALDALGYDNITGDGQVPTLSISTIQSLNVASENIADLAGIEDFVALTTLDCSLNQLITIDVSQNVNLIDLDADENLFTAIDISNNTLLQDLDLDNCLIASIDLTANTQLVDVDLEGNELITIDLTNNLLLEVIDLESNNLKSLDVANNTLLEELDIENNDVAGLVLPLSTSLVDFDATNNLLTSIDVSSYVNLEILDLDENQFTSIDVSQNSALTRLRAEDNNLIALSVNNGNNTIISSFSAVNNPDLYCILVDDAAYSTTNWTNKDAQATYNETSCDFVIVDVDVFLQGALINPNTGEESLMRDDLRVAGGLYGATSPYGDGATISEGIGLDDEGVNSTVDWIWVELRDKSNPTTVIAGQSGILQRDGDIVATNDDLATPLTFDAVPAGDYFIVVKHRNHLGIMSSTAITLKQVSTTIDFTDATNEITYGSNAQTTFGMPTDVAAMWCGNANEDTIVQYSGVSPDTPDILSTVLNDAGNFLNFPTYIVSGYDANDVNMDGNIQYSGTDPDTPFILQNVLAHPSNFLNFSTYQIVEQLPENE